MAAPTSLFPRWLLRLTGYCLALLVVAAAVWLIAQVVSAVPLLLYALVGALLLAALLGPVVDGLHRLRVYRWLAALGTELALVVVLVGAGVLFVGRALNQVDDLSNTVDRALADLQGLLTSAPVSLPEQRVMDLRHTLVDHVQGLALSPGASATVLLEVLSGMALALFVLFFLLKDGGRMWSWVLAWTAPGRRDQVDDLGQVAWSTLVGYMHGMVLVALFDAVAIGVALVVMGVPLWVPLTMIVFVGAFVPIVGALVSGALAVGVTAVTVGTWQALVVLAAVLVVQQLEGNVVQPLVMQRAVSLHPVAIVSAVTAGGLVAGVGGAVIAVPLAAIGYRVTDRLIGPAA